MKTQLLIREVLSEKWINPNYIDEFGDMYWRNEDGKYHRDVDRPAIIYSNGSKHWFKNGKRHRDGDKPAIIYSNGNKWWYKNGKFIRNSL